MTNDIPDAVELRQRCLELCSYGQDWRLSQSLALHPMTSRSTVLECASVAPHPLSLQSRRRCRHPKEKQQVHPVRYKAMTTCISSLSRLTPYRSKSSSILAFGSAIRLYPTLQRCRLRQQADEKSCCLTFTCRNMVQRISEESCSGATGGSISP